MPPRTLSPVASFGSEIMLALLAAAKPPGLIVPFPSIDMAMRFRSRLYALRAAMRRENHPSLSIAMSVRIYIEKNPPAIRMAPADSEFSEALRLVGVGISHQNDSPIEYNRKFDQLLRDLADENTPDDEKRA